MVRATHRPAPSSRYRNKFLFITCRFRETRETSEISYMYLHIFFLFFLGASQNDLLLVSAVLAAGEVVFGTARQDAVTGPSNKRIFHICDVFVPKV